MKLIFYASILQGVLLTLYKMFVKRILTSILYIYSPMYFHIFQDGTLLDFSPVYNARYNLRQM